MTTQLTDNLPLLAGAPSGIKKLRELILELAVRGKLLPQDPSDEPASELLKRVAAEKARLVAEGKIKKQKALSERDAEDPAFELPAGWAWARLSDVVNVINGRAYKKEELLDAGTPVLRVGNLFTSNHWYYSTLTLAEDKYCNPGDLLFAWSASFGPFIWHGERSIYHYHIWKLDFYAKGQLSKHYLYNYLLEQTQEIKAAGHGVSMVHMTKEKMEKLVVPVPPLAEQHRIVAKVDELMALCDRLEVRQADADSAHVQLVQALLGSLTQASNAEDFAQSWQRLAEHFHTLFTTESSIDDLKQSLLQLAVMGKLVAQDPGDEPATGLLKRIAEEKDKLVANGEIKRQKPSLVIEKDEAPFPLPSQWLWVRLTDCSKQVTDGEHLTPPRTPDCSQIPLVTAKNVRDGYMDYAQTDYVDRVVAEKCWGRCRPEQGDIMVVSVGATLGRLTVIPTSQEMVIVRSVTLIKPLLVSAEFVALSLKSPFSQKSIWAGVKQSAQPCLYLSQSSQLLVPIPPLAEQHRIVAKVDQLMALCDQLKSSLNQARQVHEHLASALVEQALA
jgi:type I restriction enzyme, S subunit